MVDEPTVSISIEIELGWGTHNQEETHPGISGDREKETEYLDKLLDICDEEGVKLTFNIVGHLLLDSCGGAHNGPYEDSWFDSDPGSDLTEHPLYYSPDLVHNILESDVDHEVATHTFTHYVWNEGEKDIMKRELELVNKVHSSFGLDIPRSFIPPKNQPVPPKILANYGIRNVRKVHKKTELSSYNRAKKRLSTWLLNRGHPVYPPEYDPVYDVAKVVTTYYPSLTAVHLPTGQSDPLAPFSSIPIKNRQEIHLNYLSSGIKRSMRNKTVSHYWSHLFNMSNEEQWCVIQRFIRKIGDLSDRGKIDIMTIEEIGEDVRKNHTNIHNENE